MAWPYEDTPGRLAELLGTSPPLRHEPKPGGNSPLELLSHAANAVARGEVRVATRGWVRLARRGASVTGFKARPNALIPALRGGLCGRRPESPMRSPRSPNDARWLARALEDTEAVLRDHAHAERKAAATAMARQESAWIGSMLLR